MNLALMLWVTLLGAADPCEPVVPLPHANPKEASLYLAIGRAEHKAGHLDTALAALRAALSRRPQDAVAQAEWNEICGERQSSEAYARAVERVGRDDWRGALEALSQVHTQSLEAAAALLAGLSHYRLNEDEAARRSLLKAESDVGLRQSADLLLGLLERRSGNFIEARRWLSLAQASSDPTLNQSAAALQRSLPSEGPLNLSGLVGVGYDSNVNLAPPGASAGVGQDGLASAAATVTARPWGNSGPFAQAGGLVRQQFVLTDFSLYGVSGTAGYQWMRDSAQVGGQYSYEFLWLGGQGYLSNHRFLAWTVWPVGAFVLSGSYELQLERYPSSIYADYSGLRHTWSIGGAWSSGPWAVGLGLRTTWDATRDPALTYVEIGPSLDASFLVHPRVRLIASAGVFGRPYTQFDKALGVQRQDFLFQGQAGGSFSVTSSVSLFAVALLRTNHSNVATLSYTEFIATVSAAVSMGFF